MYGGEMVTSNNNVLNNIKYMRMFTISTPKAHLKKKDPLLKSPASCTQALCNSHLFNKINAIMCSFHLILLFVSYMVTDGRQVINMNKYITAF